MKMTIQIKSILLDLINNKRNIPITYWNDILWLYRDQTLGMDRKGSFYFIKKRLIRSYKSQFVGSRNYRMRDYMKYTWKSFFLSDIFKKLNHVEILSNIQDINLLIKPKIRAKEIISCKNQAIKRVLIERYGYENLIKELKGKTINRLGKYELINIDIKEDELLTVVKVICPSTMDVYILRVPPTMKTCKQAVAWTFQMDENEYCPIIET